MKILLLILLGCYFLLTLQSQIPITWKDEDSARLNKSELSRVYISPEKIVWTSDTSGKLITGIEKLLKPGIGQSQMSNRSVCKIKSTIDSTASILFDYGKEIHGGLQMVMDVSSKNIPAKFRIRFGESVAETMSDIGGETNATNDHAMRDFEIHVPRTGQIEFGNTGFRFVRIDLLDTGITIALQEVRAILVYRDISYLGLFECNDERLNKIWQTGAYTVHLNMQDYLWDGIKRDRLVWIGDMHPEVMTINAVFGYNDVVPKSLDLVKENFPLPRWMNGISSYSMWWIIIHYQWYMNHGDLEYLKKQKDYLLPLVDQLINSLHSDNPKAWGFKFLDWPTVGNFKAVETGLHSLMIIALKSAMEIGKFIGENEMADKCKNAVDELLKVNLDPNDSKQAAALMALSEISPAKEMNDKVLSQNGLNGISTFYGYYVLQAMAKAGNYEGALNCIRGYWGAMLDLGATTFWENLDINDTTNAARIDELVPPGKKDLHGECGKHCYIGYRHSLCHGWSSGPTPWLSEYVLGIIVLEPGCKKIKIEPHLGDLDWVKGSYPTPYGVVTVEHRKDKDGIIKTDYEAPEGVEVVMD